MKKSSKTIMVPTNLNDVQLEKAQRSEFYFIENFIWIEDKTVKTGVSRFILWPEQRRALQDIIANIFLIILKARQLGLTWLVLAYTLHRILFRPGFLAIAISKRDDPDALELGLRMQLMLRYLPEWMVRHKKGTPTGWQGLTWSFDAHEIRIHRPDGEDSRFLTLAASPDTAHSFTANLVILDEWALHPWAEQIWTGAFPTMNRADFSGQVIGLSTGRRGTLFEQLWKAAVAGLNMFKSVFLNWRADPRRDQAWYERTKGVMPNTYQSQYPATPEEAFSAGEATAFPEFSRDIHVCEPFKIPPYWKRWRSNDPGYTDPFAWYWLAAGEDGKAYIYREYSRVPADGRVVYSDQARKVVEMSKMYDDNDHLVQERIQFTATGRDAFNRHPETGKSIVDYYREGGVHGCMEPPRLIKTDRIARKAVFHEYLKPYLDENTGKMTAKLQIFSTCVRLIDTLPALEVDPNDNEKVAECNFDHQYDGAGYGLVSWHARVSKVPEEENTSVIKQHKDRLARENVGQFRKRVTLS